MVSQVSDLYRLIEYCIGDKYTNFSLLDLGCGKGLYGYVIRSVFGFKVKLVGVDIKFERKFIPCLKELYSELYEEALEDFLFADTFHWDIILAQQVLEHLPEENALMCMRQMTKISDYSIVGFPKPQKQYDSKDDRNAHHWGCSDEKLLKVNYQRVHAITNNHVYIHLKAKDKNLIKHWKVGGDNDSTVLRGDRQFCSIPLLK